MLPESGTYLCCTEQFLVVSSVKKMCIFIHIVIVKLSVTGIIKIENNIYVSHESYTVYSDLCTCCKYVMIFNQSFSS